MDKAKTVTWTPLTGIMDSRSYSDQEPAGSFSWKQNVEVTPDGKLRRCQGFAKPFYNLKFSPGSFGAGQHEQCPYGNFDFHDQGVDAVDQRMPITMIFPSTSNAGVRKLYAATKNQIMRLDETTGDWTVIGTGYGADSVDVGTNIRFMAAELQDNIVFANSFDDVLYHDISTDTAQKIDDLDTAGEGGAKISKARVVIQYQGVIMLMNMYEGDTKFASRIRWSDLNKPTAFDISDSSSITDYQDLEYGEEILNAVSLLGYLWVFTDRAIWRCNFSIDATNNAAVLTCNRVYSEPRNKSKCLAYPNTLVSTGFDLFYAGTDAIYHFNPYLPEPERVEWIYRATNIVFDDNPMVIDKSACNAPFAEYWPDKKEIHFSWPIVDASATNLYVASCDDPPPPIVSSGINRNTLVINTQYNTCDYRDYGMTAYANFSSDLYANGGCNQSTIFVGASGQDYCLKEIGTGYIREFYDPEKDLFTTNGYYSILRGVFPFGKFDQEKKLSKFVIDGVTDGATGLIWKLRIGTSYTAMDPNNDVDGCSVLWKTLSSREIRCQMLNTSSQYSDLNLRPSINTNWDFLYRGRFLYFELTVQKSNGDPADSGAVAMSRIEVKALAV